MTSLKASLAEEYGRLKKAFEEVAKACQVFEVDQKFLQQKKGGQNNALKNIDEEVAFARQRSQESHQWVLEVVCRASD